jgi:hypothetical protein
LASTTADRRVGQKVENSEKKRAVYWADQWGNYSEIEMVEQMEHPLAEQKGTSMVVKLE